MAGIFNIPSGYSFLESLAKGLLDMSKKDPFRLTQMEIYLPTRRACIEIGRSLIRFGEGRFLLLPKLLPLGDLDEDEEILTSSRDDFEILPLITPFRRLALLTQLIEEYTVKTGLPTSLSLSLKLAKSLVKLMDQAAIEKVPWEGLLHLVPSEFANHWQLTLDFLDIVITHWPKILEEKGILEPYTRHHALVESIVTRWEKNSPNHPILAAGSTGTMPATARLLQAIANLPQGVVILPGLDTTLTETEVQNLSPSHPQYALTRFLERLDILPQSVPLWPGLKEFDGRSLARSRLFANALKPTFSLKDHFPKEALDGVFLVPCKTPQEEALAITILLRQHLEIPHQRAALITSDLKLVERVTCELKRWGVEIDSSSGIALDRTPPGVFLKLCAEYAVSPHDHVALLSLLKHPLFHMGLSAGEMRPKIRHFEKKGLRENVLRTPPWIQELQKLMLPFTTLNKASFKEILLSHIKFAEIISTDKSGLCHLWKGPQGDAVQSFIEKVLEAASDFSSMTLSGYAEVLQELFLGHTFRYRPQKHPRLAILGPIEARLFHADVMILGGLNEGNWPPAVHLDPWLNRPMREDMGFPSPERRIGLSAHDFGQAFASPKVYLTRALKVDGTPTIPCRWLEGLEVYLKAWGIDFPQEPRILEWTRQLDLPQEKKPLNPPLPKPPLKSRPRRFSVTQIETWMRDPYAFYGRHILALFPLKSLNPQAEASDRGILIHSALDQFFKVCPDPLDKNALNKLLFVGRTLFEPYWGDPSVRLFWWPRFCTLAHWFINQEKETRLRGTKTYTEVRGKMTLSTPLGPFECIAKADRIDLLPDGRLRIIDYKLGTPPTENDVQLGFSPQLPLEGAIALMQGFEGISSTAIESLQFWWIKGDEKGGVKKLLSGDSHTLSLKSLEGLKRRVVLYDDENTPYPARPIPGKGLKYNAYAHLARLEDWGRI